MDFWYIPLSLAPEGVTGFDVMEITKVLRQAIFLTYFVWDAFKPSHPAEEKYDSARSRRISPYDSSWNSSEAGSHSMELETLHYGNLKGAFEKLYLHVGWNYRRNVEWLFFLDSFRLLDNLKSLAMGRTFHQRREAVPYASL